MIDDEVLQITSSPVNAGERLNDIADQFRRGRDVHELAYLLDSPNAELVSTGVWILGELHFELYNSENILSRVRALLDHKDPVVRFHALGALYPALDRQDAATEAILRKMQSDPNEGVRKSAEAAAAQLSLK